MRLEAERRQPIDDVTPQKLKAAIALLRTYGPCSFATLVAENGEYLQVAGGRVTCTIEHRDAATGRHRRAYQAERSKVFEDGTLLVFGAGTIALQADEWFAAGDVEDVFLAFLRGEALPARVKWRDVTGTLEA